jgi:hypothetical protein
MPPTPHPRQVGSFLAFRPASGAFEANPPFVPALVVAMAAHMLALLTAAERRGRALLFAVCVGASAAMRRDEAPRTRAPRRRAG